jgi:hypothetical protein
MKGLRIPALLGQSRDGSTYSDRCNNEDLRRALSLFYFGAYHQSVLATVRSSLVRATASKYCRESLYQDIYIK